MPMSMYRASVPVFLQMLPCLSAILDKTAAHAAAKKIDPQVFCRRPALSRHVSA